MVSLGTTGFWQPWLMSEPGNAWSKCPAGPGSSSRSSRRRAAAGSPRWRSSIRSDSEAEGLLY